MNTDVMLLPCPFCGSEAEIIHPYSLDAAEENGGKLPGGCWVSCTGDDCLCEYGRGDWDSQENDNGVFDTFEEAAAAWNRIRPTKPGQLSPAVIRKSH